MPLLDHFHAPWAKQRPWDGFHSAWANALAQKLNHGGLPPGHVAIPNVNLGGRVEVDVATLEQDATSRTSTALLPVAWAPPAPALVEPIDFTGLDTFEVQVFREDDTPRLVAAIELVSPANKDRPGHRQAFVVKCASYLQQGNGLIIVDVVTTRTGNFHLELIQFFRRNGHAAGQPPEELYASAYRVSGNGEQARLEAWPEPLRVGDVLPTLPLWISTDISVPVDLEGAYMTARDWLVM